MTTKNLRVCVSVFLCVVRGTLVVTDFGTSAGQFHDGTIWTLEETLELDWDPVFAFCLIALRGHISGAALLLRQRHQ